MSNLTKHLKTVHTHRKHVRKSCWKMGLFWQGLVHDLSKYSLTELSICKYYTGKKSPHQVCREAIGYSPSWNHHYHVNKSHWEFWLDFDEIGQPYGIKMPYKYVVESFCDMLGASKAYNKENWKVDMLWDYWIKMCKGKRIMHKDSVYLVEKLIWNLHEAESEKSFYEWYKQAEKYLKENYIEGNVDY